MDKRDSLRIWLQGLSKAHREQSRNEVFLMPLNELKACTLEFLEVENGEMLRGFVRRCNIVCKCFGEGKLPREQAMKIVDSCTEHARVCGAQLLARWRQKAEAVHRTCQELLAGEEAEKAKQDKKRRHRRRRGKQQGQEEECIICLDAPRTYVFQPCGHRVSCEACARALATRSRTCPWCRHVLSPVAPENMSSDQ